jgi:hypothetical protein
MSLAQPPGSTGVSKPLADKRWPLLRSHKPWAVEVNSGGVGDWAAAVAHTHAAAQTKAQRRIKRNGTPDP